MAFPTTAVLDDFNRANSSGLGANWTDDFDASGSSAFNVSSNTAIPSAAAQCSPYWNVANYGPDCESYLTLSTKPNTSVFSHLYIRVVSEGTSGVDAYSIGVQVLAGTDSAKLFRLDNGVHTQIGSTANQEFASGDSLGLSCVGTTIEMWFKASGGSWTSLGSTTDATYSAAGKIAMLHYNDGSGAFDDFGGGTVVSRKGARVIRIPSFGVRMVSGG